MNQEDRKLIKDLIKADLKPISNSNFTLNTLERIKVIKEKKYLNISISTDLTLIYPVFIFSILIILFSIIKVFKSWFEVEQFNKILYSIEMISSLLFSPVTLSLIISFTLLYFLDSYLMKHGERFTKPNSQYR